ncbi:MAG: dynamin family protein [Mogibacterium sp.]|nr:dynamin family protein [Mogibacterium sp.]
MMTSIKIKSDPYRRTVDFYTFKVSSNEWAGVNRLNSPDSRLITDNIRKNFFPYKVKEIVEIILDEYAVNGEKVRIVFSGTSDEYKELADICSAIDNIELERDEELLENARDILPQIVDIFYKVKPIVDSSIERDNARENIERDIIKFIDASNDIIPICVLGNYSSGKSTFINALIGLEILPSGDMPVTAKIYQIKRADVGSDTNIDFNHNNKRIHIVISDSSFHIFAEEQSTLTRKIEKTLLDNSSGELALKVNSCLTAINEETEGVSDLITIQIPFGGGLLGKAMNSFVIFDTPGSNAAMHKDHFTILKGAMETLSNGIPIYVTEYNALDSCDNVNLYESIKEISQIDTRFTMIAVNKADLANIKEASFDDSVVQNILNQSVPSSLYSGGIYFVSSLMGLGSKTEGVFIDEHLEELFEDNEKKYSDPESKRYKELYKFNIMPEQIKNRTVLESAEADNKVFANSGLLALEHEIINFAEKYSAYDKCKQSKQYIDEIIKYTKDEIAEARVLSEAIKAQIENELEEDKRKLIVSMEARSNELAEEICSTYDNAMNDCYKGEQFKFDSEDMIKLEGKITEEKMAANDYEKELEDVRQSGVAILDNIGKPFDEFAKGVKNAWGELKELREVKIKSDKEASDEIIKVITEDFDARGASATANIDTVSRDYWQTNTEQVKTGLSLIVAESPTLDEDKKKELEEIIISYGSVKFTDGHVFEKANFVRKLNLFGHEIDLNRLNTRKLTDTYNKDYNNAIKKVYEDIKKSHGNSFETWRNQLVNKIRENIVDYSPKLSEQARKIEEETQKIAKLTDTMRSLANYSDQIQELISWK